MTPQEARLLNMLSSNDVTFFIPPYQRNYEWTEDQCKVFLDDVQKTFKLNSTGKTAEHFFGSITYFQNTTAFGQPNKLVLIDGQQRITTTMLFLVALRDIIDDDALKDFIDSKYLKNNNVAGESEYKIKLKQVETDWSAYKGLVLGEKLVGKSSESAVYHNYRYFYNQLSFLKERGDNLSELIEKGLDKFSVITIELQPDKNSWENPQEIFESMNSLGKPLSLADLVRNYLLLGLDADTQSQLYKKYWLHIEEVIPGQVSNFIRDFMQMYDKASYKQANEPNYKELYGNFKSVFSGLNAETILKRLCECSDIYSYIIPGGICNHQAVDHELHDIQYLHVTTAYSFMLALLSDWKERFTDADIVDILDAFRIYCMRRRILGITTAENKNFPLLVNHIDELVNADDKKEKMFEILSNQESNLRLPNDVELTRFLETANFYNIKYCKFILALVEENITRSRPDINDNILQVEHIMPQTLNKAWEDELGENYESIHQELVNTIGNLTLIRHNQILGQKPFAEKKELYENNAGLQIAKTEITNRDHWNADAINERAKWIIDFILKEVLLIPDKMRKTNNFAIKEHHGLSFQELQLIGEDIYFLSDPLVTARVVDDKEVEFEGKKWKLSPLTRELLTRRCCVSPSGAYQGAQYWGFEGMKLADII